MMDVIHTVCDVDFTYYPFDIQRCQINYTTFAYGKQLQLQTFNSELDMSFFTENGVWSLVNTTVSYEFYNSHMDINTLTATLYIQRRSTFDSINLLAPIFLLVLLNSAVFLIPVVSGERVGFSVTILLSITVYMTILAAKYLLLR